MRREVKSKTIRQGAVVVFLAGGALTFPVFILRRLAVSTFHTGETAQVGAALAGASPWRARGAEPHSSSQRKPRMGVAPAETTRGSRDRLKGQPQERQHSAAEGGT